MSPTNSPGANTGLVRASPEQRPPTENYSPKGYGVHCRELGVGGDERQFVYVGPFEVVGQLATDVDWKLADGIDNCGGKAPDVASQ
jgi:hypothetical protein